MRGVGIGWRSEIAADLLARPSAIDFVEVTAEACAQPHARREAIAIAEVWPIVTHGVKLSLGSADGLDEERARRLASVARDVHSTVVSEHVAFVRGGGREIGHLTQLPYTREAVRVVAKNVVAARRILPDVPLLLENVAWSFRWPDEELDEGAFYTEIVRQTGCDLLLDVGNLYANAINSGNDPLAVLERFPLDRVRMLHVAGGVFDHGFYFDTHAHAISDAGFALIAETLARVGDVPVVLERDAGFPAFGELGVEIDRVRRISRGAIHRQDARSAKDATRGGGDDASPTLASAQSALATLLTAVVAPSATEAAPFAIDGILRARGVLLRKRVDDALPLLPLLSRRADIGDLALACVTRTARPATGVAIFDAFAIADAAADDAALADDARRDRLLLRARFVRAGRGGILAPRVAPFVGRERTLGGASIWAIKGPGATASVRLARR